MRKALIAIAAILVAGCGSTIRTGQLGVKYSALRKPALQQEVRPEGFYWRWPWNGYVAYDVTWQSRTEPVEVLTSDALHVATRVTVTFRPDPARLYQLATGIGRQYYDEVIRPPFVTITRAAFANQPHASVAKASPAIEQEIAAALRQAIGDKPLLIDRVSIDHIAYDETLTRAISAKLAMQEAVAKKTFEVAVAEREADIARTAARGEADALRIRAEGEAQAIVLRGEAQARAQAAITRHSRRATCNTRRSTAPRLAITSCPRTVTGFP
ncbi:MAG TPA: prohibitin family protein [Gemmatimonadaceae bacterium]